MSQCSSRFVSYSDIERFQYPCQRLTKDFYKAITALPTKTPTDFDKYVTAAYYLKRTITVTNLLTPTITNKHNDDFELYVTIDHFYKA